jgi:hypothetical protein
MSHFTIDNILSCFLFHPVGNANNLKEMRDKLTTDDLKQGLCDSLETPIDLLSCQMKRLSLKDRPFQTFETA